MCTTESNPSEKPPLRKLCTSPVELRAWIRAYANIRVPEQSVCPGHHSPFRYLCDAYFEPGKDIVLWASRGGGKTRLAALATLLELLHKPGCSVRILGGSLEQSLRMWEYLVPDVERLLGDDASDFKRAARRITLAGGATAAVLTQSQRSIRGVHVQKMRCDEVDLFDRRIWEAAQLTTKSRAEPLPIRGAIEAISTFHNLGGLMGSVIDSAAAAGREIIKWCVLDILEKCPQDRDCPTCPLREDCRGTARDKCDGYFSIDDAISIKPRVSGDTWESEMLCRRPVMRDSVFPMFNENLHVRPDVGVTQRMEVALGVDFGYHNPFVALWIADDGDRVHVVDEYVQSQRTISVHIAEIRSRKWGRVTHIHCDPAGNGPNDQTAQSNVKVLQDNGFFVRSRGSTIADGLELIRAALEPAYGNTTLFINPRCKRLIAALRAYRYLAGGSELPLKDGKHDHLIDALRYYFINRGGRSTTVKLY